MKPRNELRELLTQKKLKKTSQRDLIWESLLKSRGHPSVEEIRDRLLARGHRIGLATIYRTLKLLLASGLLRQSKLGGMTRYEPVVSEPNHLHLICNECNRTVEYPSEKIESLIRKVTAEYGFEEKYSRYVISGLCKACQKKQEKAAGITARLRAQKTVVRDALELTLAVERLGLTFYTNASRRTKNASGRRMFERLAAEESEHLRRLQKEHESLLQQHGWLRKEPALLPISRKIAQEIFPQKDLLRFQVNDQTTELEALSIAMDLERRSHEFFKTFAVQLKDSGGRKAFMEFARDEASHFEMLLQEYNTMIGQ